MLELVPLTARHFRRLIDWSPTPKALVQWAGPHVRFPLTDAQLDEMVLENLSVPPVRRCWMALLDGEEIGHAQLGYDWRNGVALLSKVVLAPSSRGRGIRAPMLRLVVASAFAETSIHRLELNVFTWNHAAIRTYERLGFQVEGVRRSSALVGGERWDTMVMGLLRSEWLECSRMKEGPGASTGPTDSSASV
jgi:RimJ/RimL family protein N-acetyltransferase